MTNMDRSHLTVLVLGGGPDRERDVSLVGAAQVASALREAGHEAIERDIMPDDVSALDETFDVVFPVLHGRFGEGGPLQRILEHRGVAFVGCTAGPAATAIDKIATKQICRDAGIATPDWQRLGPADALHLDVPAVIKPIDDGSSVDVLICHNREAAERAATELLAEREAVIAERLIAGRELTVGIIDGEALPLIEVVPAVAFYDYQAKYDRDDTEYRFDPNLPVGAAAAMAADAVQLNLAIGCRHLSRVDFMLDADGRHWMLEINTMPGFTTHSLVPMAARKAGLDMPALCDRLVRLALRDGPSR
jgi:D-alanine-D-alanine ligase